MPEPTEDDYLFLPVEEAERPVKGGLFIHYVNGWWTVHPEKGLVFFNPTRPDGRRRHSFLGFPQHNSDERVARRMAATHYPFPVEVRQLPSAWVQANPRDYAQG